MDREIIIVVASMAITSPLFISAALLRCHTDRRLRARGSLLIALGSATQVAASLLIQSTIGAVINAAVMAVWLHDWWNNGGGDGMRKIFKKARSYLGFTGKLAPQGA